MTLPAAFIEDMRRLWAETDAPGSLEAFLESLEGEAVAALRANTRLIQRERLQALLPVATSPVPWTTDGLYLPPDFRPALEAAYQAGLYYIQDPAAMLPAAAVAHLAVQRIVDLCAAPGGKACKLSELLPADGYLLANEKAEKRARALLRNLERMGSGPSLVTVSDALQLPSLLAADFDLAVLDVPCSGSGMFRKDPRALAAYQDYGPEPLLPLQAALLEAARSLLKDGGYLCYSTCSYSYVEDEGQIAAYLQRHPEDRLLPIPVEGAAQGLCRAEDPPELRLCRRIWPHQQAGEGQFCALLQVAKQDEPLQAKPRRIKDDRDERVPRAAEAAFKAWCMTNAPEALSLLAHYRLRLKDDLLFLMPKAASLQSGLLYFKTGVWLGMLQKDRKSALGLRLQISHPWAVFLPVEVWLKRYELKTHPSLLQRYLKGESFTVDELADCQVKAAGEQADYALLCYEGAPVGCLKQEGGRLKNLYPPGWIQE